MNRADSQQGRVEELVQSPWAAWTDDIVLVSDAANQAQELLLRVERECKEVGLMLNSKKTKAMFLAEKRSWKGDPSSSE